jgi:hypothetical protein
MSHFDLMSTRYTHRGINTVSDVEIYKCRTSVKTKINPKIYHLRIDWYINSDQNGQDPWKNISYFLNKVIPTIDASFVLLITGEDFTIPNNVDVRWQEPEKLELLKKLHNTVVTHPLLLHCYIENRDEVHEKTSSLPLGINPREGNGALLMKYIDNVPPISERDFKVIAMYRDRPGDRMKINKFKKSWGNLAISGRNDNKEAWLSILKRYPLIICPHGGGLDPSPKAWEALCLGCIPIIKHSALDDIYSEFPVVFVDDWNEDTITMDNMKKWIETHGKYYDDPVLKDTWKHKLYKKYWEDKIKSHFQ